MSTPPTTDHAKAEQFAGKALGDMSGAVTVVMCALGDRLGLFKDLAANGPTTSAGVADRVGLNERYVREWLSMMSSAGYLHYEPATQRFALPPEHIPVLAQENGPFFFGGMYQIFSGWPVLYEVSP